MDDHDLDIVSETTGGGSTSSVSSVRPLNEEFCREQEAKRLAAKLLGSILKEDNGDYVPPSPKRTKYDDVIIPAEPHVSFYEKVIVRSILTGNTDCTHEVAFIIDMPFKPLVDRPAVPAKSYPFKLDAFQREAIACIENSQSVIVSAPTSAGKTVVALYAIAQSLRDKQRVIYTSPVEALSNQKFQELEKEFGNVGLMTGDVTLYPNASCLVMTTEVLRSMLYRGSEVMREVGWVIFDEAHFISDEGRSIVWEESIILLPVEVRHVFLSTTIPNALQFAKWVCWLHRQPVHVVCTNYQPTPRQHFIFPVGGEGLYEVVNIQGQFRQDNFTQAMSKLELIGFKAKEDIHQGGKADSDLVKIIRTMKERSMLPCIIFSFSRKECEACALSLKNMDFNDDDKKKSVLEVYHSVVDVLSDEEKKLPQVEQILPLLLRGIGVHHSGLLPILVETVEILFGEGLLKTLFSTETFSMGLSMPAKTVLITSVRKVDGVHYRWISSGNYIQMSGKAGRRGKDDRGLVILMVNHRMNSEDAKHIIKGAADPFYSQFRLTFNMVLNAYRTEVITPEFMLGRSFHQFQKFDAIPDLQQIADEKMIEIDNMHIEHEDDITAFFNLEKEIANLKMTIKKTTCLPSYLIPFLSAGRMLHVVAGDRDFGWAVLLNFHKKINLEDSAELVYILDVFMEFQDDHITEIVDLTQLKPATDDALASWDVVSITLDCVDEISIVRLKLPRELISEYSKSLVQEMIRSTKLRFRNRIPLLHPVKDMRISEPSFIHAVEELAELEERSERHPLRKMENFDDIKEQWLSKDRAKCEYKTLHEELRQTHSFQKQEELGHMKQFLRCLEYLDNDIITDKGRCACELSASDGLMLTEMLYGGVFRDLTPAEIAALLSCLVFQEDAETPKLVEGLPDCFRNVQEYARRIAKLSLACKLDIIEDEYVGSFKPGIMDIVYRWMNGASFEEVMRNTDIFEGTITRCIRRLAKVLRELVNAAKLMQNEELEEKFEVTRSRIERDIVFAASLYI